MLKVYILYCVLVSFSAFCYSKGAYRHFLFVPAAPLQIDIPTLRLDDYTEISNVPIRNALGTSTIVGTVYSSDCWKGSDNEPAIQEKTTWLIVPREIVYKGMKIEIKLKPTGGWSLPYQSQLPGYSAMIYQRALRTPLGECWHAGESIAVDFIWSDAELEITVPKQSLIAGHYSLQFPIWYGFEENKFIQDRAPSGDIPGQILALPSKSIGLELDVVSKCIPEADYSGGVNLNYGAMTAEEAEGKKTRPVLLRFECREGTTLSIKLSGSNIVPGKTSNFTRCGAGICELNFNGNKYNETMKVLGGSLTIPITSTYHFDQGASIEGPFNGSGIISFTVN